MVMEPLLSSKLELSCLLCGELGNIMLPLPLECKQPNPLKDWAVYFLFFNRRTCNSPFALLTYALVIHILLQILELRLIQRISKLLSLILNLHIILLEILASEQLIVLQFAVLLY
ncbi:MAG: hypothetical protein K0R67_1592 [Paenibacillus sp.]|nr:hypothetical protein [Paenibacillus sp.]